MKVWFIVFMIAGEPIGVGHMFTEKSECEQTRGFMNNASKVRNNPVVAYCVEGNRP